MREMLYTTMKIRGRVAIITSASLLSIIMVIGLFFVVPTAVESLLKWLAVENKFVLNLTGGVLRMAMFLAYVALASRMKEIKRVFMYHGAEHKSIYCFEAGKELTVENVRKQRRFHPRCGTSFLILMLLVSIFISFFIDPITIAIRGEVLPPILRTAVKLLLLPLIVGLGYELIKFAGRHDNALTRIISAPGVWLQHLTVLEPTDDMIECAIASVKRVIPDDGSDQW